MPEMIDVHSLELAANYIKCVRALLQDLWDAGVIPGDIESKYQLKKLENGLIDIQFP